MTSRDSLTSKLERLGARVTNTISRHTDVLLVGVNPGETKLAAARARGVPILSFIVAEDIGLLDERCGPRGLPHADDFVTELTIQLTLYTEDLLGLYWRTNDDRYLRAWRHARRAARRLLQLAWGNPAGGSDQGWTDALIDLTGSGIESSGE